MIKMNIHPNQGYAPDQVVATTLGDLAVAVEQAIANYGEDAQVVTFAMNNRYGANYGELSGYELFTDADDEEEEDDF